VIRTTLIEKRGTSSSNMIEMNLTIYAA